MIIHGQKPTRLPQLSFRQDSTANTKIRVKDLRTLRVGLYTAGSFVEIPGSIPRQAPLSFYQDSDGTWIIMVPGDYPFSLAEVKRCPTCQHTSKPDVLYVTILHARDHYCVICATPIEHNTIVCTRHREDWFDQSFAHYCTGCRSPIEEPDASIKVEWGRGRIFCQSCLATLDKGPLEQDQALAS